MHIYLVQHGDALPETTDPERPLTDTGRADIGALAQFMRETGATAGRIVHSGKLRARQTADIFAEAFGADTKLEVMATGLSPKDSPVYLAEAIADWRDDTLVVAHQPFLSRFVSRVLLGAESPVVVEFTPGTAVALTRRPATGALALSWVLPPTLLRR